MFGRLGKVLGPEGSLHGAADGLSRLRIWAATVIVLVSVASAVSVLKASVYDERASQEDAVYRQELVTWQQTDRSHEEEVARDVALFGGYEQHALHARDLQREAAALAADLRLARALRSKAEQEKAIAAALLSEFRVAVPATNGRAGLTYSPSVAYRIASSSPQALAEDVSPGHHRLAARSARHDGVRMAKIAALFIAALVFLTVAQVYAGAMAPKPSEEGKPVPKTPESVLRLAYTLFVVGTLVALFATGAGLQVAI